MYNFQLKAKKNIITIPCTEKTSTNAEIHGRSLDERGVYGVPEGLGRSGLSRWSHTHDDVENDKGYYDDYHGDGGVGTIGKRSV